MYFTSRKRQNHNDEKGLHEELSDNVVQTNVRRNVQTVFKHVEKMFNEWFKNVQRNVKAMFNTCSRSDLVVWGLYPQQQMSLEKTH